MGWMAKEIVGREGELAALHDFLAAANERPSALVFEGEAGIGKTTLWLAGVEAARERGMRVLTARPAEAERGLAHAVLGDLLEGVLDEVLPALSSPRRRALEGALLVDEAPEEAVEPRTIGVAVRTALQVLAAETPVVLALDDVQWLDPSSTSALVFALRRMEGERVRLLLARRLDEGAQPSELERTLEERLRRLTLGPLSVGALHGFLRDRLERSFPRQTLLRIHETSGGNPFFALELARALGADVDPGRPLLVPETLEELVRARLGGLPAETREALEVASALGAPSWPLLERAGVAPEALDAAVGAHVVESESETGSVRFTHPLLSAVLYQGLSGQARRTLHERLAAIVDDPLVRARHLALATDGPDADVAAALDDAATRAVGRGAPAEAAELGEHALRLTPPDADGDRHRRALAAAHAHLAAGEWIRARSIVAELLSRTPTGPESAEALLLLAELASLDDSIDLLEDALQAAAASPALQSDIHRRLAWAARFRRGYVAGVEHARAALELAEKIDDDARRARALVMQATLVEFTGESEMAQPAQRAHELATAVNDESLLHEATLSIAGVLAMSRRLDDARNLLEHEHHVWHERDELASAEVLWDLAWVELWAGHWALAAEHAVGAHAIFVQYRFETPPDLLAIAAVAVHRGQLERAREHSERALELAEEQFALHPPVHQAVLGLIAHWSGDAAGAADWLGRAEERAIGLGWREPSRRWWNDDHAEALLELGRIGDAIRVLDVWEEDALRLDRRWVLGQVTRSRGLVAAAEGDVAQAVLLLEEAVAKHEEAGDRFGRSRALLSLGVVRRRARQKRAAREAIEAALLGFEQLGAATWVEKARDELGSIGGRKREEGLTPAEQRVAALVAEGRTNREVAAALFLGERTVEAHLSRVYAKLGIRSRTELARTLR
jgi:DNA-binding CsgD family transcriptional regulator